MTVVIIIIMKMNIVFVLILVSAFYMHLSSWLTSLQCRQHCNFVEMYNSEINGDMLLLVFAGLEMHPSRNCVHSIVSCI